MNAMHAGNPVLILVDLVVVVFWIAVLARMFIDRAPDLRLALGREYLYLHRATEPVMSPFRRLLPPLAGYPMDGIGSLLGLMILRELLVLLISRL